MLSLFVPVTAAVPDSAQNPVRHARVGAAALERWRALGADETQLDEAKAELAGFARESSAPAPSVSARAAFWSPAAGLRVFGLPFTTEEAAWVAIGARLRPVALAAQRPSRFRVLVLSANHVALFEGDEAGLEVVRAPELPASLEAALGSELSEASIQYHSGHSGAARPIYHGQGGARRARKLDLERFHRRIAAALEAEIGDDIVPLVLAADAFHRPGLEHALGRDVGLVANQLEGNVEHLAAPALHAAAWPLVADDRSAEAFEALERARERKHGVVTQLSELVSVAVMGRVRRLWVPEHGSVPGRIDPARGRADEAWGDDDLIDNLMVEVLRRGGLVHVLAGMEFPAADGALAAELR